PGPGPAGHPAAPAAGRGAQPVPTHLPECLPVGGHVAGPPAAGPPPAAVPPHLNVSPSVAMWLADEQQAGRLRLSPQMLVTAGELRSPAVTQRLLDAVGVGPLHVYGSTEGLFGSECEHHQGIHLFEDTTLVENVDGDGQSVPAGQPRAPPRGHKPTNPFPPPL